MGISFHTNLYRCALLYADTLAVITSTAVFNPRVFPRIALVAGALSTCISGMASDEVEKSVSGRTSSISGIVVEAFVSLLFPST
jgi:hypothetical protein